MTGGLSLPEGGQYQADGFVIAAKDWDAVPVAERDASYPRALPIAAFELLSPANLTVAGYTKEFTRKLEDYQRSAIPLVGLLHPKTESATIRRPGREGETTTAKILTFPELPGLELNVGEVYAAVNNP